MPDAARDIINGWVSDQTAQRIPELLPDDALSVETGLVLTNAVYFKGSWLEKLDPAQTMTESFHGESGDSDVSMMHSVGEALYATSNGYQMVARPFLSPSVMMLLVLPPDDQPTTAFDVSQFATLRDALSTYLVTLSLPKWQLDSARQLKVKAPLQDLGMQDAFDDARADFSGISTTRLTISEIYHSAFVSVDEQGVEAAAATAVVSTKHSIPASVSLSFDRPFMFLVYDQPTGQILFFGRVTDL
jgi:serpin B